MAELTENLQDCAQSIINGDLVAFPTETVYGLGANALNPAAVQKIFEAKKRPLTDPVIVHVGSWSEALPLIEEPDSSILSLAESLALKFWPGPLTFVLKHSSRISKVLTAGTAYVGIRCPNHELALSLISLSNLPIAAPSANLFSHVSPTRPSHVLSDFGSSEYHIKVLNGGPCSFGIESTVIKIVNSPFLQVEVLRRGGVSEEELGAFLGPDIQVCVKQNYSGLDQANEAPGQLIKHYSPNIDTFLLEDGETGEFLAMLDDCVVIDYGSCFKGKAKAMISLSEREVVEEAIKRVYDCLRLAETQGGKFILIKVGGLVGQHASALWDRVYRASSGRRVVEKEGKVYIKMN